MSHFRSLGLMSGTSLDGIDLAVLETDGESFLRPGPSGSVAYQPEERALLRLALEEASRWAVEAPCPQAVREAGHHITLAHVAAVRTFLGEHQMDPETVDIIGFHGQTVLHQPEIRRSVQIGLGAVLADRTGIPVVSDFRAADLDAGGQGAPFAPLYHRALARALPNAPDPAGAICVLNLGGVGNITWMGSDGRLLAFDTGPANALIDDWVGHHTGVYVDREGALAAKGCVQKDVLAGLLDNPYFGVKPPKSLDRLHFPAGPVRGLSLEDGAATLSAFSVACVERARVHLPEPPVRWVVCGGGRHNPVLMAMLREQLEVPVDPAEAVGWRGDSIEAEAFAYLAVRSLRGLPLSVPGTTGVPRPLTGGVYHKAASRSHEF